MRLPFSCAPAPREAVNSSLRTGIDDHRVFEAIAVLQPDRHGEVRDAVQIVRGAVEWIDDPRVFGTCERLAALFADDAVIRIGLVQDVDDGVFAIAVDVGDEIVARFLFDVQRVDAVHRAHHDLARPASGAKRHVDHCMHEQEREGA